MTKEDDRARQEFTSEAEELLDAISLDLASFESQGREVRPELVNKLFREVHSLKGLAGMLGFGDISELSHNLEDMLDRLRMGRMEVTRELMDLLYDSVDSLNRLVIAVHDPQEEGLVDLPRLVSRIHQMVTQQPQRGSGTLLSDVDLDEQTLKSLTEYEEHRLRENLGPGNEVLAIHVTFDFTDFDEKLRALSARLAEAGELISTLPSMDSSGGAGISFRLLFGTGLSVGEIAALSGPEARVESIRRTAGRPGEPLEAPAEDDLSIRSLSRTVRVDISRLDHVMNIVGELIIEKTHLELLTRSLATQQSRVTSQELTRIGRNFDRRLNELQKSVIEIRMVPVGQIYSKVSRVVRKIARDVSKEIELVLRGEETELDKMMVEELTDPLMHIIRNAIDHGIEPAEARAAAGKPPAGVITLSAYQKGNSVVIDISDDGRGIDPERIRMVAVRKGMIDPGQPLDPTRAMDLLFTPGFSTAETVSEVSGRGVGLDVVRKNIQDLKGSIEVLSEKGKGTTFRIVLPITLAILQALIVRTAGETFAIPLTSVEESLRIRPGDISTVERKEVYALREFTLPLLRLADAFGLQDQEQPAGDKSFVVVTRSGDRLVGLVVDALVRQQEIVIKAIGERLKTIPGVAGAAEIGENEIILVVDVGSLIDGFGGAARDSRRGRTAVSS